MEPPAGPSAPACKLHVSETEGANEKTRTERKIAELVPSLHLLALLHRRVDAPDHHRADAHAHHPPKLRAIDRHDLAHVLPVHVQRGADRLRLRNETYTSVKARPH